MTTAEAINIIELAVAEVEWEYPISYAAAFEMAIEALKAQDKPAPLPCKIGDTAYAIRRLSGGVRRVMSGVISEMYYSSDMTLVCTIRHLCRGEWGKVVFGTYEEAEAALNKKG